MAEAQRTNKPSGKCHYCLMISKTCKEASKTIPARGGAPKEEYLFINAEEEFFYEVRSRAGQQHGSTCWNFFNSFFCTCLEKKDLICLPAISKHSLFLLFTASGHQVPLLGSGGGRLLPERQVVVRRRPHEAVQDCDADPGRQDACRHGQTEGEPDCVNLQINTRLLSVCVCVCVTPTLRICGFIDITCYWTAEGSLLFRTSLLHFFFFF